MKDYDENVLRGFIQRHNIKSADDLNNAFKTDVSRCYSSHA